MKRLFLILVPVMFLACGKQQEPVVEQPLPFVFDENLQQIDSLMQTDAGSALMMLINLSNEDDTLSFRAQRGTTSTFNTNYQSLLISEALYKTYNPQLNRYRNETFQETSLHEAVQYFDSLYANYPKSDDLTMLSARSHYMNGVGYYENDSVVDACREYFKTLEIMENHFEEKDMVGNKAKFMSLIYGRLSELFSDQFMPEPSIYCGKQAFHYRKIKPTSRYGVSNILYRIGVQYDVSQQIDTALYYYNMALGALPDSNNLVYRDIMTNITLLLYGNGYECSHAISDLQQIIKQTDNENEKLTRYIALAYLYYCENQLDTALFYFKHVFENKTDDISKYKPAEYLRNIHLSLGDTIKTQEYDQFLANNTVSQYDKMIVVSILNDLFYEYLRHRQDRQKQPDKVDLLKRQHQYRVYSIVLSVVILLIAGIIISRIKVRKTIDKSKIDIADRDKALADMRRKLGANPFINEPICNYIWQVVAENSFKAKIDYKVYKEHALDKNQIMLLRDAVDRHYNNFTQTLSKLHPELTVDDIDYCCLYLLGLKDADISALIQRAYPTVHQRSNKLKHIFNTKESLQTTIASKASESLLKM